MCNLLRVPPGHGNAAGFPNTAESLPLTPKPNETATEFKEAMSSTREATDAGADSCGDRVGHVPPAEEHATALYLLCRAARCDGRVQLRTFQPEIAMFAS